MLDISSETGGSSFSETADDDEILCAACKHVITRARWRISRNGDHAHTVFNPAGVVFQILCFKEAPGSEATGGASGEFTWFRGYNWRIAVCGGCGQHLGWRFEGPDVFFGLIKPKLDEGKKP